MRRFGEECHLPSLWCNDSLVAPILVKYCVGVCVFSLNHRQHLLIAFKHLDSTLNEVLSRLSAAPVPATALFQSFRADVDPVARDRASAAMDAVRDEVRAFMATHEMSAGTSGIGATHAANALLALAMVSAAELGPRHLRGYGELTTEEASELEALSSRLQQRLTDSIAALPEPESKS